MQVIALAQLLHGARHAALDAQMTFAGFLGIAGSTLCELQQRGTLSPKTADKLIAVARRIFAPSIIGLRVADRVHYASDAVPALHAALLAATAELRRLRATAWPAEILGIGPISPRTSNHKQTCE